MQVIRKYDCQVCDEATGEWSDKTLTAIVDGLPEDADSSLAACQCLKVVIDKLHAMGFVRFTIKEHEPSGTKEPVPC